MQYLRVRWKHHDSDEPVLLYSELGDDRYETRKVEVYADGSAGFAGPGEEVGTTWLGDQPVPPLDEINADAQFEGVEIDAAEFERVWAQRRLPVLSLAELEARR
jgi:Domain of unknown function (DUF6881)